jgi:Phage integrase family
MTAMRIAFVKEYTDRTGKLRRYFRKRGRKPVALPGAPGSPEFMKAYQMAMGSRPVQPAAAADGTGTVSALILDYKRSPAFASNIKPTSRSVYRLVLDQFDAKHGHRLVVDMPRDKVAAYVYEIGAERNGRPMTGGGLSAMIRRAAKDARLPAGCSAHGLRKAMTRRLAEGGATAKEIASVSGHKTLREIERYTDKADQRRLSQAAMNKLETPSV